MRPAPAGRPPPYRPAAAHRLRTIAFHKPYRVLSQFTGAAGQPTLSGFGLPEGVYPAGRLDLDSEGLLILSNDGRFIHRLLDPKNAHERTYLVQVEGLPDAAALTPLRRGLILKGERFRPCTAELLTTAPDLPPRDPPIRARKAIPTAWLELTLTEGKNRQVRPHDRGARLPDPAPGPHRHRQAPARRPTAGCLAGGGAGRHPALSMPASRFRQSFL